MLTRRSLLFAPAVVAVGNIMPVKLYPERRLIWSGLENPEYWAIDRPFRALYVGEPGNVTVEFPDGSVGTIINVPGGHILPIKFTKIISSTADALIGLTPGGPPRYLS